MNTLLLDIPQDPVDWPAWLETELLGLHLYELVNQLQLLPDASATIELSELLSVDELNSVAASGISALSQQSLRRLLRNPMSLLPLQEFVLTHGHQHWQTIPSAKEHGHAVERVRKHVRKQVIDSEPAAESTSPTSLLTSAEPPGDVATKPRSTFSQLATLAALFVVGLGIWMMQPPAGPEWGFAKADLEQLQVEDSAEYLNHLADAGNEWFKKQPATAAGLKQRLTTFSQGCQALINAPHSALSDSERQWLVTKCQAWKTKVDGFIVEVDTNPEQFQRIQADADDVVNRLVAALRAGVV